MSLPIHGIITIVTIALLSFASHDVFSQIETSEQTTLSGDLSNNPVAQDILKKIEQTKQWIADLEQREYEKIEAQKFLDERRSVALESLNQDLISWEDLWANYTSRNAFERFVDDKPSGVQGVFWDQFEFKEMKVNAGREALKKVIADGGSLKDARNAYLKAAETKRIELIEANAQFNVKHNLAYYSQQLLFDIQGQFVNTTDTRGKLSQYYTDYRADPSYLAANPNDKISYESLGKTNLGTECRDGYVVVHRFHANDYACITKSTAEMWVQRGMGEIPSTQVSVFPNDKLFGTGQNIQEAIKIRELGTTIYRINEQFQILSDEIDSQKYEMIKKYNQLYANEEKEARDTEMEIIKKHSTKMTDKELTELIYAIRNKYKDSMEDILDDKVQSLEEFQKKFDEQALLVKRQYDGNSKIDIIWDSDIRSYQAVLKDRR